MLKYIKIHLKFSPYEILKFNTEAVPYLYNNLDM